jgi:hypothetical protein
MKSYVEQAREAIADAENKIQESHVNAETYEIFKSLIHALQMLNIAVAEQARKHGTA